MNAHSTVALEGANLGRSRLLRRRITLTAAVMIMVFGAVAARLIQLGVVETDRTIEGRAISEIEASRPTITDRNGLDMAMDLRVPSIYAEPRRVIDVEEAVAGLTSVMPDLNPSWLRQRLTGDKGFVWIKREITPAIQDRIMQLGLPGIDFLTESKRFYPGGRDAAHVLGLVNIDSQGIAGIERNIDDGGLAVLQSLGIARGQELEPVQLTIDMRVQHAMRSELEDSLTRYKAIAAAGVIVDVQTGEILAMASLPDFDPNMPVTALEDGRFNRITAGNFELGSVIKTVSFAAALDSGAVRLTDRYDARFPIRFGRQSISDFRGANRVLTVPEIFRYSSNVGTVQMVQTLGKENYRDFMTRLGFDTSLPTELPERTAPNVPAKFSEVAAATASFGHGFSISPLHLARAFAAFVNGGKLITPTLYPRTVEDANAIAVQVIKPETSDRMRYLLRYNAEEGSGSRMNRLAAGYRAGGKTGTAEKVVNGRYGAGVNLNVFVTAFPMEAPRYAMVILVDEAQAENAQSGNTAGWNAGEVSGRIVARIAPMLGVTPSPNTAVAATMMPPELLQSAVQ